MPLIIFRNIKSIIRFNNNSTFKFNKSNILLTKNKCKNSHFIYKNIFSILIRNILN